MQIYLDYSATTPTRPEAIAAMQRVMEQQWGNPSSLHAWGERSAVVLETARAQVASAIRAPKPESIVFTAGGTEANNLALMGVTRQYDRPQHLIISSVEHSAVSETARWLESRGWQVTRLGVNAQGRIDPLDLQAAIRPDTVLISIIFGQSEVGTLQPIDRLAQIARQHHIPFHTDAVQVAGRLPIDVRQLGVDLLSLSSHKLYGPQGVGALYIREGVSIEPLVMGGGQERRLRSGTQGVPAIAGFGVAAALADRELAEETPRLIALRDRLFECLADCPYLQPTGDRLYRLPHHVSFTLNSRIADQKSAGSTITGRSLVRHMNLAGIGISAGTACHSGQLSPSPVLLAMGYSSQQALAGIRLTLGRQTEREDVEWAAIALAQILDRLHQPATPLALRS